MEIRKLTEALKSLKSKLHSQKMSVLIGAGFSKNVDKEKFLSWNELLNDIVSYSYRNDAECTKYIQSTDFQKDLSELLIHDQQEFDEPKDWQTKTINDSPLVTDFSALWASLRSTYQNELIPLAFLEIPEEKEVENIFVWIIKQLH